jgi:hypothetical protein
LAEAGAEWLAAVEDGFEQVAVSLQPLHPETPRLPLYVSRRLTGATRTTMRNKRRQRHLHVCRSRGLPDPAWASDREALLDVLCLALDMPTRLANPDGMRCLAARGVPAAADP